MPKGRGLLLSRGGFPGSQDGSFTCANMHTSQSFLPPQAYLSASPAVVLSSVRHRLHGSRKRSGERECILVKHASAFTQANDLAWNPAKHYSIVKVLPLILPDCVAVAAIAALARWTRRTRSSVPGLSGLSLNSHALSSQPLITAC